MLRSMILAGGYSDGLDRLSSMIQVGKSYFKCLSFQTKADDGPHDAPNYMGHLWNIVLFIQPIRNFLSNKDSGDEDKGEGDSSAANVYDRG